MHYTIIPMTQEHLAQVAELERRCFSDPWSEKMLAEHMENPCAATVVAADEDGTVLGYGGVLVILDEGYITNVAVRPECRRRGVASRILQAFDRYAQEKELAFLTLEVRRGNDPARALYAGHGFEEVGVRKNYYDHPKEDAILMTRHFVPEN